MSAPLLDISGLSAISTRENARVLRDVDLVVAEGEVHGLVGESGAGKSTIAKAVLDMLPRTIRVTGGRIVFRGRDLASLDRASLRALVAREIALIPQDPMTGLNPTRRIEAQLTDGMRLVAGMSRGEARERALALLEEVRIADPARTLAAYPHELSGGMRQRVLIAAAFALEPKLVVADEPTTALDVTVQKQILRLIRGMQERHGTGVIFVTHDLGVVAKICDRVTLLYQGKVVEAGTAREMIETPRHAYTRALLAASPRYDRPEHGCDPVPGSVVAGLEAEIARHDEGRAP
ncbi:ABC transporter ATP-binding protein [Salinarimonas ramus]|uniref:ABC transporter ATP-binding protein n=1 Tax=Salinarimonas ramus TaxID=690164 RepID=A0A917QC45_9HYPH|nr:ABC transporter ATP-binding protein [Salinarimonas ramus]GGK42921.1 ABC transporter ATP-binding protein [Salinarimonas ramus]